ncbi:thioredoxin-like domain-containing protein [Kordia zhangzhouensis]|uniref:thioredoxin-like domain-containing protein n=1 Tax=Kordia zhangzhouensis TaxID=1620405 RepID=UPI000629AB53|nr:thioredoxin-like domain-containing protein [Kordia zhangzhouensis]
MKYFTLLVLFIFCVGCDDVAEKSADTFAYFGGEIINPADEYVLLYHQGELIDSLKLDENNRFLTKLKNHKNGLYKFYHNREHQYINLEKGDSLLLRLNTYAFDESLFFTGKGAEKNNFYVELFLLNENHERPVYQFTRLDSDAFLAKIDSLQHIKLSKQTKFLKDNPNVSQDFKDFTDKVIKYCNFRYRETYQNMFYERKKKDSTLTIADSFFDYKDEVNMNDSTMSYYIPYTRYVMQFINNSSYSECLKKSWKSDKKINTSLIYNKNKLALIDSLVSYPFLRNELLRYTAYSYYRDNTDDIVKNNEFFNLYQKAATDKESKEEITDLHNGIKSLQFGNSFSSQIYVYNDQHARVPVNQLNSKRGKTIFYFWTSKQLRHKRLITEKIKVLAEEFPNLNIIGISLDTEHKHWRKAVKDLNFPESKQYRVGNKDQVLRDYALISINKLIITDQNGNFINGFADIYDTNLKDQLK